MCRCHRSQIIECVRAVRMNNIVSRQNGAGNRIGKIEKDNEKNREKNK